MQGFFAVLVIGCAISQCLALNVTIPFKYPLFKQCDPQWADDFMGTKTICAVGCLMSSTSMGLAGVDIPIQQLPEIDSDPKTLNTWLKINGGYDNNNLIEGAVQAIDPARISWTDEGFHKTNDLPYDTVVSYLEKGRIVIGNVHDGGHFILLTGYSDDKDTFAVNDPGYAVDTYSYTKDIMGYRIFDMKRV